MVRLRRPLAALIITGVAAGCSSGPSGGASPAPGPPGPTAFTVAAVDVQAVATPAPPLPADVQAKVVGVLDRYLAVAVAGPLRSGGRAGDLGPLFTRPALDRVNGPDRAALVDEGLPAAPALRAEALTARLGALVPQGSEVSVVTASLDMRLQTGGNGSVTIARSGDLVLVPDGTGWKIDGYDVRTSRDSADGAVTTTTARR